MRIRITIITVCYNAGLLIGTTIESVKKQTYPYIEYLIMDGASTDNTENVVRQYADSMPIRWFSEPDRGIYDAMNKGVKNASGDYIYFLNAGDCLYDEYVMEKLVEHCLPPRPELLYGNIIYQYPDGTQRMRRYGKSCGKKIYYLTGDCINHQALLASRGCFEKYLFDCDNYKICADREWMMRLCKDKIPFVCTQLVFARYSLDEGSTSVKNREQYKKEAEKCIQEHLKLGYPVFRLFEFMRNNRIFSTLLRKVYQLLYIRKSAKV